MLISLIFTAVLVMGEIFPRSAAADKLPLRVSLPLLGAALLVFALYSSGAALPDPGYPVKAAILFFTGQGGGLY